MFYFLQHRLTFCLFYYSLAKFQHKNLAWLPDFQSSFVQYYSHRFVRAGTRPFGIGSIATLVWLTQEFTNNNFTVTMKCKSRCICYLSTHQHEDQKHEKSSWWRLKLLMRVVCDCKLFFCRDQCLTVFDQSTGTGTSINFNLTKHRLTPDWHHVKRPQNGFENFFFSLSCFQDMCSWLLSCIC